MGPRGDRFRTEAEAIARIRHPGIVQVYDVGEVDGLPFITLEYCPGGSLADALAGTSLPARSAAELAVSLADAMEAAHRVGVVHRDLKPANVLLSELVPPLQTERSSLAGSRGPKITDFGLAKLTGEGDSKTRTGAVLGTPSYMAPEQAEGKKDVGPAADVYALGAILYECLTCRPPFKAAIPLDTLIQVVSDEPVPVRRLQPAVPRDLETICLKCLEKTPHRRYVSAGALADDLRRFLAGEPVAARPAGPAERAWKWARRRPAATLLLAVCGLGLIALTAGGLWYQDKLRRHNEELRSALDDADRASKQAERERRRAQDHLYRALAGVERMAQVGADVADPSPDLEEQRRKVQQQALELFRDFLKQESDDPRVRRETARAYFRSSALYLLLNQTAEAETACRKAIRLLTRLAAEFPAEPDYRHELCQAHGYLGHVLTITAKYLPAVAEYEAACQEGERLVREHPGRAEYLTDLTGSLTSLGYIYNHQDAAKAERLQRRAVEVGEQAVRLAANADDPACRLASAYHGLALVLFDRGRKAEADEAVRRGRELVMPAGRPPPATGLHYQWVVPNLRLLAAQIAVSADRPQEAEAEARLAISALEALARRHPLFFPNRVQLEPAYTALGTACWALGKDAEAEAAWQKAVAYGRQMAKDFPTFPRPVLDRDRHLLNLAGESLRARRDVKRAVAVADRLAAKRGVPPVLQYDVACAYALAAAAEKEREEDYATRALEVLRRPAVVKLLRSNKNLFRHARTTDRDLDSLRGRTDFREWLAGIEGTPR
jgi:tetratricopeptide (TPR) repeat protein